MLRLLAVVVALVSLYRQARLVTQFKSARRQEILEARAELERLPFPIA